LKHPLVVELEQIEQLKIFNHKNQMRKKLNLSIKSVVSNTGCNLTKEITKNKAVTVFK
jgi:hypothetical protein